MNFIKSYILSLMVCISFLVTTEARSQTISNGPFLIVQDSLDAGIFSSLSAVLGCLDFYEQGHFEGFSVNLTTGFYLDPAIGKNWWDYYFEPLHLGNENSRKYLFSRQETVHFAHIGFWLPRERAAELIQKYIRVRPEIQAEVNSIIKQHFENQYVIGIDHRKKDTEYEKTSHAINQAIENLSASDKARVRIYVATDDPNFLKYISDLHPSIILHQHIVSPTLKSSSQNFQSGKEALIDCLLLSKVNILLRPPASSLSIISGYFHPTMPVTIL